MFSLAVMKSDGGPMVERGAGKGRDTFLISAVAPFLIRVPSPLNFYSTRAMGSAVYVPRGIPKHRPPMGHQPDLPPVLCGYSYRHLSYRHTIVYMYLWLSR